MLEDAPLLGYTSDSVAVLQSRRTVVRSVDGARSARPVQPLKLPLVYAPGARNVQAARKRRLRSHRRTVLSQARLAAYCICDSIDVEALFVAMDDNFAGIFEGIAPLSSPRRSRGGTLSGGDGSDTDDASDTDHGTPVAVSGWTVESEKGVVMAVRGADVAAQCVFVVEYGAVVFWNLSEDVERGVISRLQLLDVVDRPLESIESDDMTYCYDVGTERVPIRLDNVILLSAELHEKLAVSFAFAQSVKLSVMENRVDDTISCTEHLPEELAETGSIPLTVGGIAQLVGELYILRGSVNFTSDLLDLPEFMWKETQWEPAYTHMRKHLDIDRRVETLNKRMDIIRELLDVLQQQTNSKHASKLELIVIWLIVVEVVIEIVWNIVIVDIFNLYQGPT